MSATKEMLDQLEKTLIDEGKIIDAGFVSMKAIAMDPSATEAQVQDMRAAFFAGAAHLWGTIMNVLEEGEEPTENDMSRMDKIQAELDAFIKEFELRHATVKGRA